MTQDKITGGEENAHYNKKEMTHSKSQMKPSFDQS